MGSAFRSYLSLNAYNIFTIGRSLNISLFPNEEYFSVAEYSFKHLEELLAGKRFVAIVDFAYTSVPNTSFDDPIKDFSDNLYNVIRHLDFARVIKAARFVYISSGGTVYGESNSKPFSEDAPNFPLSPYGVTKLACERYVYMYNRLHNLPTLIVRPSNIYGPGQKPFRGQGLVATALGLAVKGEPIHVFGNGSHVRDYLYVDDFSKALINVIDQGEPGKIYNIGSGLGVSILDIVNQINRVLKEDNTELSVLSLPERPFDVHFNVLDIKEISQLNGWQPEVTLHTGIENTWKWIKEYLKQHR